MYSSILCCLDNNNQVFSLKFNSVINSPGWGYPILSWLGYPLKGTWDQWKYYGREMGYSCKGHGTKVWDGDEGTSRKVMWPVEVLWDRDGVNHTPPPGVNWHTNWKYYLPHPSDLGGKNGIHITWLIFVCYITLHQILFELGITQLWGSQTLLQVFPFKSLALLHLGQTKR